MRENWQNVAYVEGKDDIVPENMCAKKKRIKETALLVLFFLKNHQNSGRAFSFKRGKNNTRCQGMWTRLASPFYGCCLIYGVSLAVAAWSIESF
jgi:hypothetical protein